jgi:arylsulfatase A-like enzyme
MSPLQRASFRRSSPVGAQWWILLVLGLSGAGLAASQAGCSTAAPPNVVLITVDTLRADHLHVYGFPLETSPSIDALAARSALFERAISASAYTGPSHASMMTSKYPRAHSMGYSNGQLKLAPTHTLAAVFRDAGYDTAAFVSNDIVARRSGLDQGFGTYDDELPQPELHRPKVFERIAEQTTRRALAWLDNRHGHPFFLWVHYQDPHGPYTPPAPYRDRFRLPSSGEPELNVLTDESGFGGIPHYQELEGLRRPSEYESRYAGEIAYADYWIGQLLAQTEARSAPRPLVVLLTADHGESFGEDNVYFAHGHSTTPDVSHVPMILHLPDGTGERRAELVSHVDVMPTLLEAAGLAVPPDVEGLPLTRVLRKGAVIPERPVFCDIGYELSVYRQDEFLRATFIPQKSWDVAMFYQSGQAARQGKVVGPADLKAEQTFRWGGGKTWSATDADPQLKKDLLTYLDKEKPAAAGAAVALGPADAERLHALGYAATPNVDQ